MYLSVQVSESLVRLIVPCATTDVSNDLINFPMYTDCKEEGQKPYQETKN